MTDTTPDPAPPAPRRTGRRAILVVGVLLIGGLGAALATKAVSHGYGHGWGHHRGGFMGGSIDPADAERRAERMMKHLAVEIDATPEQQDKLTALARVLAKEVAPLRDRMRETRKQAVDMLTAPTVDRAAIEKLRAEQLTDTDAITKRVSDALADAAEVLTPEQRKALAERIEGFRDGHGKRGWGRGWNRG